MADHDEKKASCSIQYENPFEVGEPSENVKRNPGTLFRYRYVPTGVDVTCIKNCRTWNRLRDTDIGGLCSVKNLVFIYSPFLWLRAFPKTISIGQNHEICRLAKKYTERTRQDPAQVRILFLFRLGLLRQVGYPSIESVSPSTFRDPRGTCLSRLHKVPFLA